MQQPPTFPGEKAVAINDQVLSSQQLSELERMYGKQPPPGHYWYDPVCGLYGLMGQPSAGFLYPGHEFGKPIRQASRGTTGVLINGRELPQAEYLILGQILGTLILPGAYWLDGQGNAGLEGNSFPIVNLFVASRQNAYSGSAGNGGDNFWSSRFSAGNAYSDGSAGYVSVPGYGPVGYG